MKTFKDSAGDEWEISINVGSIKRVRDLLKVDLTAVETHHNGIPLVAALSGLDVLFLVDVICALCRPQLKARDMSDEEFAERLEGDVIASAQLLFLEEWHAFFQSLNRTEATRMIRAGMKLVETAVAKVTRKVDKAMETATELLNADELDGQDLSQTATESPASSV